MQASLERIRTAREAIWLEEPADIARLRTKMTDTADVVRRAKAALPEVKTLEEFVALAGELSLYIGRMDYWVDLLIPWAKFGRCTSRNRGDPAVRGVVRRKKSRVPYDVTGNRTWPVRCGG